LICSRRSSGSSATGFSSLAAAQGSCSRDSGVAETDSEATTGDSGRPIPQWLQKRAWPRLMAWQWGQGIANRAPQTSQK
jgi:hypothetical protein